jgi:hypothetical protein
MKSPNTPASRLFNWNLLGDALKKLDVVFDVDVKNLIVAGDYEIITDLLLQLKTHCDTEDIKYRVRESHKEKPVPDKPSPKSCFSLCFNLISLRAANSNGKTKRRY